MSLEVSIALRAEQDMTLQYRWYLKNADLDIAEGYLLAVHETIQRIAEWPGLGRRRRFRAPELVYIRSIQVKKPYDCHLLFYMQCDTLRIERVMHGARDLPNRLTEDPEG
jgi:plasmid stabilization system protein ParE